MKKFITIIILLTLSIVNLYSTDKQFYFVGKYGRLGSLSQDAHTQNGIYLRWDLIEGDFPQNIDRIKLIREEGHNKTTTLLDIKSNEIMSSTEIAQMFQSLGSQRRLLEIINAISKNDNPNCTNANIGNIGNKVRSCLKDNYWSFLASRVNFDIARARYRAYLDTTYDKKKTSIDYKLIGMEGNNKIILGKTRVFLKPIPILGAKDFKQIIESKCNDNRYGLDDYRVGLSWKNGGKNTTEFFANGLMVSGYDIYYSTKPISSIPGDYNPNNIDIANIASKIPHNSIGELDSKILLSNYNLAKANETLITIGEKATDGKKPIYLESMETLKKRGFKPGEYRYYFLVPRDFTGNYGKTVYLKVYIPDLLKPAKPINPRTIEEANKTTLIWNSVTPKNYLDYYQEMKACSKTGNRVTFIEKDEDCKKGKGLTLNFNVKEYYVYRFESNIEASSFEDKNLNGIDDVKEELNITTCKAKNKNLPNHLVKIIPHKNGEEIIKFHDNGINQGKEYWYKIVSVAGNITSQSTMPIRAFVPKRALIDAPEFSVTTDKFVITEIVNNENQEEFFIENNTNQLIKLEMNYNNQIFKFDINPGMFILPEELKNEIFTTDTGIVFMKFFDINNRLLATYFSKSLALFKFNQNIGYSITGVIKRLHLSMKGIIPVKNGTAIEGNCIYINMNKKYFDKNIKNKKVCTEVTLAMGNKRYKVKEFCDNNVTTHKICAKESSNNLYSLAITMHYDNGLMSYPRFFSFIPNREKLSAPNKPALDNFNVDIPQKSFSVSIKPQVEKVTGTMLYLYNKDKNISTIQIVPHLSKYESNKSIDVKLNVSKINLPDTWCIKGKTIGLDGQVSKWSTPLCRDVTLSKAVQQEDLLAWPRLTNHVVKGKDFNISFEDNQTKIKLIETYIRKNPFDYFDSMDSVLNFVVYRSRKLSNGDMTKFVQISPLINKPENSNEINKYLFGEYDNLSFSYVDDGTKVRINFIDKYPYIVGEKYQYVLLFFNKEGEISSYSLTYPRTIEMK